MFGSASAYRGKTVQCLDPGIAVFPISLEDGPTKLPFSHHRVPTVYNPLPTRPRVPPHNAISSSGGIGAANSVGSGTTTTDKK